MANTQPFYTIREYTAARQDAGEQLSQAVNSNHWKRSSKKRNTSQSVNAITWQKLCIWQTLRSKRGFKTGEQNGKSKWRLNTTQLFEVRRSMDLFTDNLLLLCRLVTTLGWIMVFHWYLHHKGMEFYQVFAAFLLRTYKFYILTCLSILTKILYKSWTPSPTSNVHVLYLKHLLSIIKDFKVGAPMFTCGLLCSKNIRRFLLQFDNLFYS